MPKVTVLMPVYNGERFIRDAIESILKQTYQNYEFIIVNDGSTDSTEKIVKSYKDIRIKLINNPSNLGIIGSLNKGLEHASGDYIARQDSDDIAEKDRLELQVKVLEENEGIHLVSCDLQSIDSNSRPRDKWLRSCKSEYIPWLLMFDNWLAGHSQVMFRRKTTMDLGGYSYQWIHAEDYDLWSRIARADKAIAIIPHCLQQYRVHAQSISKQKEDEQRQSSLSISQANIAHYCCIHLSLDNVQVLRGFWIGQWWHYDFPLASEAGFISQQMQDLKQGYLSYLRKQGKATETMETEVDRLIAKQFAAWLCSPLTSKHGILSKIKIAKYAFSWGPRFALAGWLFWLLRLPKDSFTSVYLKLKSIGKLQAS